MLQICFHYDLSLARVNLRILALKGLLYFIISPEFDGIVFPLSRMLQGSVIVILTLICPLKLKTRIAYIRELIVCSLFILIAILLYYIILCYAM